MSMVERVVYSILESGLSYFTDEVDNGRRFERFLLNEVGLRAAEAAKARIYFAGGETLDGNTVEASPPTLLHGYARTGGPFPCWALILGGEQEANTFLGDDAIPIGDDGNRFFDPETGEIVDPKVLIMNYTIVIHVISTHPDITYWYYQLLKHCIRRQKRAFFNADIEPPALTGTELIPDPRYLPSDVFIRQLSLAITGEEVWGEELAEDPAFELGGLHADDGSTDDAAITTYVDGE